jgi:hypothetical protein
LPLQGHDRVGDGGGQLLDAVARIGLIPQRLRAAQLILFDPVEQTVFVEAQFLTQELVAITAVQKKFHGLQPELWRIAPVFAPAFFFARPPHGGGRFLSLDCWVLVFIHVTLHSFHWSVTPFLHPTGLTNWSMAHAPRAPDDAQVLETRK